MRFCLLLKTRRRGVPTDHLCLSPLSPLASTMSTAAESSFSSLLSRPPLYHLPFARLLRAVYSAISPAMPSSLVSTPVTPSPLPAPSVPVHYSSDEGHAGRVVVPGTSGGSIPLSDVLSASDPCAYTRAHLMYAASYSARAQSTELVFFSPGLNTVLEPLEGEIASITRLQHYADMLAGFPIASIHTGTSFDQGAVRVPLPWWLRWLEGLLPEAMRGEVADDGEVQFEARNIDAMQTSLSFFNVWDTPLKQAYRDIMEATRGGLEVVLMVYSRASVEFDAALRGYLEEGDRQEKCERLGKCMTVVTIGNASRWYQDGPRYIHLAAWRDGLTNRMGVNGKWRWRGGKNAVYLNCDTPWNQSAFDNHNFSASTCQFLAVVMEVNRVSGFKELWEKAQTEDGLVMPENLNQVVNAMIVVTRGKDFLWQKEKAWQDVDETVFPDRKQAVEIVRQYVGEEFADALDKNFPPEESKDQAAA